MFYFCVCWTCFIVFEIVVTLETNTESLKLKLRYLIYQVIPCIFSPLWFNSSKISCCQELLLAALYSMCTVGDKSQRDPQTFRTGELWWLCKSCTAWLSLRGLLRFLPQMGFGMQLGYNTENTNRKISNWSMSALQCRHIFSRSSWPRKWVQGNSLCKCCSANN